MSSKEKKKNGVTKAGFNPDGRYHQGQVSWEGPELRGACLQGKTRIQSAPSLLGPRSQEPQVWSLE